MQKLKQALKTLLEDLEEIEREFDGLGDTDVRERMGDHVLHAFLRPEPGFVPTGKYGLDPEANSLVAKALAKYCKAADAVAKRLGLNTFAQRVAAFQDPNVTTSTGIDYNDYFGVIELQQARTAEQSPSKSKSIKPAQRLLVFDHPGSLQSLLAAFNQQANWPWRLAGGGAEDPRIETALPSGARIRVREGYEKIEADGVVQPPDHGFWALLESEPERIGELETTFRAALQQAAATNLAEKSPYWW